MNIAFVTSAQYSDLTDDDRLASAALEARGESVSAVVWNDPLASWNSFDSIIVRSTWDYYRHPEQFRDWMDGLELAGAPVWNPPALLRWNMEKTYLRDLQAAGVPIVPTVWVGRGSDPDLSSLLEERGWHDAVVKPVISAAANRTVRLALSPGMRVDSHVAEALELGDVMVQPFVPEIQTSGEWSMFFIDGEFSHAVRKTPMAGDFRVQAHLGGDATTAQPGADVIHAAYKVLENVASEWLYARVDGIETAEGFVLLELEMLEPSLYFLHSDAAPARFADAVIRRLAAR